MQATTIELNATSDTRHWFDVYPHTCEGLDLYLTGAMLHTWEYHRLTSHGVAPAEASPLASDALKGDIDYAIALIDRSFPHMGQNWI